MMTGPETSISVDVKTLNLLPDTAFCGPRVASNIDDMHILKTKFRADLMAVGYILTPIHIDENLKPACTAAHYEELVRVLQLMLNIDLTFGIINIDCINFISYVLNYLN